jgi:hypothetical protein
VRDAPLLTLLHFSVPLDALNGEPGHRDVGDSSGLRQLEGVYEFGLCGEPSTKKAATHLHACPAPAGELSHAPVAISCRKTNRLRTLLGDVPVGRPRADTRLAAGSASDTADTRACSTCPSCQAPAPGQIIRPRSNISRTSGRSACVDHLTQREFDRVDLLAL